MPVPLVQVAQQRREEKQVAEAAVPHQQQRAAVQRLALVLAVEAVDGLDVELAGPAGLESLYRFVRDEDRLAGGHGRDAHPDRAMKGYDFHGGSAPRRGLTLARRRFYFHSGGGRVNNA